MNSVMLSNYLVLLVIFLLIAVLVTVAVTKIVRSLRRSRAENHRLKHELGEFLIRERERESLRAKALQLGQPEADAVDRAIEWLRRPPIMTSLTRYDEMAATIRAGFAAVQQPVTVCASCGEARDDVLHCSDCYSDAEYGPPQPVEPKDSFYDQDNPPVGEVPELMSDYYMTIGVQYGGAEVHPYIPDMLPTQWVRITAPSYDDARQIVAHYVGNYYSMLRYEDQMTNRDFYFPDGEYEHLHHETYWNHTKERA